MMLSDKIWVNIFGAKRGSTFVYNYLMQHPQIAVTKIREVVDTDIKYFHPNYYKLLLKNYDDNQTKVILDGMSYFVWDEHFKDINKFIEGLGVKDAYFIYLFREPYKVLISKMLMCLVFKRTERLKRIVNGEYRFESLEVIKRIDSRFPRENIYFCCIEDFIDSISNIFNFLGLEYQKLNRNVFGYSTKDILSDYPEVEDKYNKHRAVINRDNELFNWVSEDYKSVDDKYGTKLIERYKL